MTSTENADTRGGEPEALRARIAEALAGLELRLGPNAQELAARREPVILSGGERDEAARLVLAVVAGEVEALRARVAAYDRLNEAADGDWARALERLQAEHRALRRQLHLLHWPTTVYQRRACKEHAQSGPAPAGVCAACGDRPVTLCAAGCGGEWPCRTAAVLADAAPGENREGVGAERSPDVRAPHPEEKP